MNQNHSGLALLLILALAGIATGNDLAWMAAAVTAALAFLAEEALSAGARRIAMALAAVSWVAVAAAGISFFV